VDELRVECALAGVLSARSLPPFFPTCDFESLEKLRFLFRSFLRLPMKNLPSPYLMPLFPPPLFFVLRPADEGQRSFVLFFTRETPSARDEVSPPWRSSPSVLSFPAHKRRRRRTKEPFCLGAHSRVFVSAQFFLRRSRLTFRARLSALFFFFFAEVSPFCFLRSLWPRAARTSSERLL